MLLSSLLGVLAVCPPWAGRLPSCNGSGWVSWARCPILFAVVISVL